MGQIERWKAVNVVRTHLVIWGASDQCRVNHYILEHLGCKIDFLIDDTLGKLSPFESIPLGHGESGLDAFLGNKSVNDLGFIISIGNPFGHIRLMLHNLMKSKGIVPVSFADPTALICRTARYGDGLQVMPAAIVHNDVVIGDQCIINTRALVEHDCVLHDGVEIGPGAVLCGRVNVGKYSWIGAGATIKPRVSIGENTIIGAGSVVVSDIPSNVVAVGVPAKVIRRNV